MRSETSDRAAGDPATSLPPGAESVVGHPPAEPFWCENLLFALYDPRLDIGFWLHLGTVPNDWTMWEERVLVLLPEGLVALEGGGVLDADGRLDYARVEAAPRLRQFVPEGESLPVGLSWDAGRVEGECVTRRSMWTPMRKKYAAAMDMTGTGLNYALNFSRCTWEGEEAWVYSERSEMLNHPAPDLHRTGAGS